MALRHRVDWDSGPAPAAAKGPTDDARFIDAARDTIKPWEVDTQGFAAPPAFIHRFSTANGHVLAAFGMTPAYMRERAARLLHLRVQAGVSRRAPGGGFRARPERARARRQFVDPDPAPDDRGEDGRARGDARSVGCLPGPRRAAPGSAGGQLESARDGDARDSGSGRRPRRSMTERDEGRGPIHLHCGDCAGAVARRAGLPGEVWVWRDSSAVGPCALDPDTHRRLRAEWWDVAAAEMDARPRPPRRPRDGAVVRARSLGADRAGRGPVGHAGHRALGGRPRRRRRIDGPRRSARALRGPARCRRPSRGDRRALAGFLCR